MKICKYCRNLNPRENKLCIFCGRKKFRKLKKSKKMKDGAVAPSSENYDSVFLDDNSDEIIEADFNAGETVGTEPPKSPDALEGDIPVQDDSVDFPLQTQEHEHRFWERDAQKERKPKWGTALILTSIAVVVGIIVFVWIFTTQDQNANGYFAPEYAAVPDVADFSWNEALETLYAAGFEVISLFSYSDTVPAGYVISQFPRPEDGLVGFYRTVYISISQGAELFEVPSFTGHILSEALVFLEQNDFRYQVSFDYANDIPVAHVIRNTSGELPRTERIDIVVSLGPPFEEEPEPVPTPTPLPVVTVSYNPNSGAGFKRPVEVTVGENHIVLPNTFTRDSHTFVGWNTHPAGFGVAYLPGSIITSPENDITLYAIWQAAFVPVSGIVNVPTFGRVFAMIPLTGAVFPENATVRFPIIWEIIYDGGTGAVIYGNFLTAVNSGNVVLQATVRGGLQASPNIDFTDIFIIQFDGIPPVVTGPISHRAAPGFGGTLQINFIGDATGFSLGGNVPVGVAINNNGLLTWTAATPRGAHSFWITAANRYGTSGPFTITLFIE